MYYVYALIDPRNGQAFYVGKGKGRRFASHLRETATTTINLKKFNKIQSIRKDGLEPLVEIIKKFESEVDAYNHEKHLIESLSDLTNIQPGGLGGSGNDDWKINNPSSKTKGMTYEQRYGEEKAAQMKEIRSLKLKGRVFSNESRQRMAESAVRRDHSYKQKQVQTPLGIFDSLHLAAEAHNISDSAMSQRLSSSKYPDFIRLS
jgi:hypothetical protein